MKNMPESLKVALVTCAILIIICIPLSINREPLEKVTQRSNLTMIFSFLDRYKPHDLKAIFFGSSRFVYCIKSDIFARQMGIDQSKVINLATEGGGAWEELLVCRKYPGLINSSSLVVIEVEPWMFNMNPIHPIYKRPHPFESHFYMWATLQERWEYPDLKTRVLLLADYVWPFSERRSLMDWGSALRLIIKAPYADPHLSLPVYQFDPQAYQAMANDPNFTAGQITRYQLNDFKFAPYKAEYFKRLIKLAEKNAKKIVLLQPPVRKEYIEAIYNNPKYFNTYIQYVQFIHGLENEKISSIIWQTPEDCGLNESIFIDYGHFNAQGAHVFTQRLSQELKASGFAGTDTAGGTGPASNGQDDIRRFVEALKTNPDSITVMQSLAIAYSNNGDYENALRVLNKMREIHPNKADIYYNISCIKAKQGSLKESVEWLRLALSKGFKNRSLLVTDKDLDAIKGTQGFREIVQKMN